MGKRKTKDANYLRKKIRKLESKLRKLPQGSEDDSSEEGPNTPRPSSQQRSLPPPIPIETVGEPSANLANEAEENFIATEEEQLPEEFLLALGKEGEEKEEIGEPIRPELALRWSKLMSDGMGKESKTNIIDKYPIPSNFPNAVAPLMNAEILATLSDPSVKRDKRIVMRQNLTGKLMICLGRALTNIMKGNLNCKLLIEQINDAAKFAAEIHCQDSSSRKFFALAGANKVIQEAVKHAKMDKFLFGSDCADKIKAAQSIQRTSSQISENKKKTTSPKPLNWRGPPQSHQPQHLRARGGQHHRQQPYKRQPRSERSRQTDRRQAPRAPARTKSKHYR